MTRQFTQACGGRAATAAKLHALEMRKLRQVLQSAIAEVVVAVQIFKALPVGDLRADIIFRARRFGTVSVFKVSSRLTSRAHRADVHAG